MKKRSLFVFILFFGISLSAQSDIAKIPISSDKDKVYTTVEKMPLFPSYECQDVKERGNNSDFEANQCAEIALEEFISRYLKYPDNAFKAGIEGKIDVSFIVEKNGSITHLKLLNELGGGCTEEVKKFMGAIQENIRWIPGEQNKEKVRVKLTLSFYFDWAQENLKRGEK